MINQELLFEELGLPKSPQQSPITNRSEIRDTKVITSYEEEMVEYDKSKRFIHS